jgi:hypothetical protein
MKPSGYAAATPKTVFSRQQLNNLIKNTSSSDPIYDCLKNSYGALNLNTGLVGTGTPITITAFKNQYVNLIPTSNAKPYDAAFRACLVSKGTIK